MHGPEAVEDAGEVDRDEPVPLLERPLVDAAASCSVPALLKSSERPPSLAAASSARRRERVVVGDVGGVGEAVDLLGDGRGAVAVDVDDRDPGALLGHAPARWPARCPSRRR